MKRRFGKTLKCFWKIKVNNSSVSLSSLDLRLVLHDPNLDDTDLPFVVEDSCIVFYLDKAQQTCVGKYSVTLYASLDGYDTALDSCDFVTLVYTTCDESNNLDDTLQVNDVNLTGSMEIGVQGDSAYECWIKAGHAGTVEDFLNWLRTPVEFEGTIPTYEDAGITKDVLFK